MAQFRTTRSRHPVALAASPEGSRVYTANRSSGTISVLDVSQNIVVAELKVGGRPVDIACLENNHLLVLDASNSRQLILADVRENQWHVVGHISVAAHPIRLLFDRQTQRCYVTSLWSRTVSAIDLSLRAGMPYELTASKTTTLPFEPRAMCLASDRSELIVAGSFDAVLAVLQTPDLNVVAMKQIPGHNIRGLALGTNGRTLLVAQQELHALARSTRNDVHWGNMMSNLLVSLSIDEIRHTDSDIHEHRMTVRLGEPGNAAGDPGQIHEGPGGDLAIVLSGVHEVALSSTAGERPARRVAVGQRPVAIDETPDGRLIVANEFSDSVSVFDPTSNQDAVEIPLGSPPEPSPLEKGEALFFDARVSHDGWMSCHSCHTDGHSNGQFNDNLSDQTFNTPKRVLSLLGVGETGPWAWNGKVQSLHDQTASSVQTTMQGRTASEEQVAAIVAYLESLPAPPQLEQTSADGDRIQRGRELFQALDCERCHIPTTYTSPDSYDVGLKDALGNNTFNPPSLRGAVRHRVLFHDGRAKSLEDVVGTFQHQLPEPLSSDDAAALIEFLQSI